MARSGVTQEDVNAAADQLLQAGERPTIERVRAALGTGSPNTLIRLLDVWWLDLGERLQVQAAKLALPEAPPAVVAAGTALWEQALLAARTHAADALDEDRRALDVERARLEAERVAFREQTDACAAAQVAAQHAQGLAEARFAEAQRLAERQDAHVRDLLQQRDASQHRADRLEQELLALGDRLQRHEAAVAAERETHLQYVRTIEDRAHGEVDRSRQEVKGLRGQLTTLEREHAALVAASRQHADEAAAATALAQREAAAQRARADALEHQVARFGDLQATIQTTLAQARAKPAARRATSKTPSLGPTKPRASR